LVPTNGTASTLFEDSRGRIWVGTDRQVGVLGPDGVMVREVRIPGRGETGSAVFFAEHAGVVVLAWKNTLYRYREGVGAEEWVSLPGAVWVTGLAAESSGRIWVGSYGQGLYAYDGREVRRLGVPHGLPAESVGSLIFDPAGHLWFSCGRQAARGLPDNLWKSAGPGREDLVLQLYGESDGLRGLDFSMGTQPAVAMEPGGKLWFGLVRGAAAVDPAALRLSGVPPRVLVESLQYVPRHGRHHVEALREETKVPVLPAGIRQVKVRYAAIDFRAPERHRYRVRLGGEGAAWQEMGAEREVVFFEMPPGRHRVRVVGSGSDGVWNTEGVELVFVVSPFFWQAWWFRASAAAGLLGLAGLGGWLISERRLRQLKVRDALRGLARALTAALDAEALGRRVAETCRALFRHDAFFLVLVNRDGSLGMNAYLEDTPVGGGQPETVEGPLGLSASLAPVIAGQAMRIDAKESVGDGGGGARTPWGFAERRSESMLYAPIRWEDQTIGVVSVQSYTPRRYGAADLEQLQMLAAHCGAAIARMEAEEQRRENEGRLRLAMETAQMGSWELELGSGRLVASPEAEAVYRQQAGVGSDGRTAEFLWRGVPGAEAEELRRQVAEIRAGRAAVLELTHRLLVDDGERWVEVKGRVHSAGGARGGGGVRLIGLTTDVTARRQTEQSRERLEEQLRHSQKQEAIGTLAGGIAHDFNNLLAAILGNVEAARLDLEAGHPAQESLEEIQRSGLRARDLVRRILAFSQPQDQIRTVTHLGPLMEEVVKLMRSTIPAGVAIRVECQPGVPPVLADPSQLHQVLLNLGTNAWHAVEGQAGRIHMGLEAVEVDAALVERHPTLRVGRHARVSVTDDGRGMAPDVQARIFDPFFTTKPPGKGTGLGLAVALAIVKSHAGAITVTSVLGQGTTFHVYLPVDEMAVASEVGGGTCGYSVGAARPEVAALPGEEQPSGLASSPGASSGTSAVSTPSPSREARPGPAARGGVSQGGGAGGRILFVDDEESLLRLGRRLLERAGYAVTACANAGEALDRFRADPGAWDGVVTDLAMPGQSGLEMARELLRIRPDLGILLCSGNLSEADLQEARSTGVRQVLPKPYAVEDLLPAVGRLVGDRKSV
jgi:signal transduction histidine kinase/ActR/RegA family two-component response regulator